MKAKIYFIVLAAFFAFWAQAKHVTVVDAQSVAQKYFSQTTGGVSLRSEQASSYTLAYTAKREESGVNLRSGQAGDEDAYFYIFNTPDGNGFIIVSADDRAYPVLGYSLKGAFNYAKAPPVFVQWLIGYQEELEKGLTDNPQLEANPEWQKIGEDITLRSGEVILGTAEWDQGDPYNLQCPIVKGEHAYTGCVPTAMAIIMKYHADNGFAATGTGSHSYKWQENTLTANFGTYDWANMLDNYEYFSTNTQRNAVALLMSHCGISVEAMYGEGGTSAFLQDVVKGLTLFFGYDQGMEYLIKTSFSDAEWKNLIKTEIDNNRPILYGGSRTLTIGHAFVCEGYNENDEYAMNWGWGGWYNGFFRLNALQPVVGSNYILNQDMIIGIKKGSGNVSDINQIWLTKADGGKGMSKNVDNVVQNQLFTVTGENFQNTSYNAFYGKIAVALTDASGSLKEVISNQADFSSTPLRPNYYQGIQFSSCRVTKTIVPTDLIRMVSSTDNGATWQIIKGKTGVIDFLSVVAQNVAVTGVSLNSNARTLIINGTYQLIATVSPDNATNKNVTWTSSDSNVAEVISNGFVIAKAAGTTTITVTTEDGNKTATCIITVQPANVPVTGVSLNSNAENLTVGETFQLIATINPENATNKNILWTSNNVNVAEVNASGLVTAKATGSATITVTTADGFKTATCIFTVQAADIQVDSVSLNSIAETLTIGGTFQLTATVDPDNATNKNVTWTSSNPNIAEVDASGLVTAKAVGTTTITVTTVDGAKTATCIITVQAATVSVTGVSLNSNAENLTVGETFQLTATVDPDNATNKNVTWTSSNANIAEVDTSGLVTAKAVGKATITVTTEDSAKTATCIMTVQAATVSVTGVSLNANTQTLTIGGTFQLTAIVAPDNATNKNVTWTSSNVNIAEVNASGLVTAKATGTATITVTTADGAKTATCIITVQAATIPVTDVSLNANAGTLTVGGTYQLIANVLPSNATNKSVTWSSSNSYVASVNSSGLVLANSPGTATITVYTDDGNKQATCVFTVETATIPVSGVTLNSSTRTMKVGETFQLTATITPSNATNQNVTWTSNNASIASVNTAGLVTANNPGTATITITTIDGNRQATCAITVESNTIAVSGVALNSTSRTMTTGETFQLTATVTPSNATNQNVIWSSNNASVASVNASGFVTANNPGSATITVTTVDGNKQATCTITVISSNVPVTGVSLNSSSRTMTVNETFQLTATVTPSNATNQNINWSSSNHGVANVNSSGLVTAYAAGSSTITVTTVDGSRTATCQITVSTTCKQQYDGGYAGPITWRLCLSGTLTLTGSGNIPNYLPVSGYRHPWYSYRYYFSIAELAETITGIGMWAFYDCASMSTIVIPPNVTRIGTGAFSQCSGLPSIIIPKKVQTIEDNAFHNCSHLRNVTVYWTSANELPTVGNNVFLSIGSDAILHVPAGTTAIYASAPVWKDFIIVDDVITPSSGLYSENDFSETSIITGMTGNTPETPDVWMYKQTLYVYSNVSETIEIYALSGVLLYKVQKGVGQEAYKTDAFPKGALIIKGSSGWVKKILNNKN